MIEALGSAILVMLLGVRAQPKSVGRLPITTAPTVRRASQLATFRRRRPPAVTPEAVAAWCDALAAELRTGATLAGAVREARTPAVLHGTVCTIAMRLERGMPLRDALDVTLLPHLDVAFMVLTACAEHGGPAAEPLDRAAATLRSRAADLGDRRTHSAQARMSARVMTVLPVAMLLLLVATSSATRQAIANPFGLVLLTFGGALNIAGWRWMRHLIEDSS